VVEAREGSAADQADDNHSNHKVDEEGDERSGLKGASALYGFVVQVEQPEPAPGPTADVSAARAFRRYFTRR